MFMDILAADDESVVVCGRDVMNSGMWRVYLQNCRDVGSTLLRARAL